MRSLWLLCCIQLLIGFTGLSHQVSTPRDSYYVAGVVEFEPGSVRQTFEDQLEDNLVGYLDILASEEMKNVDIVVFPELTLNNIKYHTFVPDPSLKVVPCGIEMYEDFFQELSCVIRDLRKYLVINVLEVENCTSASQAAKGDPRPCARNGLSTYNTNVAFDRDGAVIGRYRKYHIYGEQRNVTYLPELSTFETDFGVKFGMFICFDINFYSPVMDLVKMGVTDFIYTSFWYSELPFLTAVQIQQAWAYANEVNLLAAGGSYPSIGSTGTGIYAGKQGALVSVMAKTPERRLYIANVTKHTHQHSTHSHAPSERKQRAAKNQGLNDLFLMREYRMNKFTSQLLTLDEGLFIDEDVCHETFCCNFNMEMKRLSTPINSTPYKYHMMAYDGDRQYSDFGYTRYRLCAIVACLNTSMESCGRVFDDNVTISADVAFVNIEIEARFPIGERFLIMPNTLDQNLYPLSVDRFDFVIHSSDDDQRARLNLLKPSEDLLTFGIYANYYEGRSSSDILTASVLTALIGSIVLALALRCCVGL